MVTDQQVKKMRQELEKHGNLGRAAMNADMDRKTARKYRDRGRLPSESTSERTWRTRKNPFEADWKEVERRLEQDPGLDAKTLFDELLKRHPERYAEGQIRTFQRHVRQWRASAGPPKEVSFPQDHRPAEAMQTDFTNANELEVTIGGAAYPHLLCQSVLPYSNWGWATPSQSESLQAMKQGVQAALRELGGCPKGHQTDNSTGATHRAGKGDDSGRKRPFNAEYLSWMNHLGLTPGTTAIGAKEQNGDVESSNRWLKHSIDQALRLRGCRDFDTLDGYHSFLVDVLRRRNQKREPRLSEERALLLPLPSTWYPEYAVCRVIVTAQSTVRVARNTYSVPARLIGEEVEVRRFDDRIEVRYRDEVEVQAPRLVGRNGHRIDYRHVAWSLVKKPGAFARYRYRDDLFPTLAFRRAHDALHEQFRERRADTECVRILHLAASTLQSDVEGALELALEGGEVPDFDRVRSLVRSAVPEIPAMEAPQVDLTPYDGLIVGGAR